MNSSSAVDWLKRNTEGMAALAIGILIVAAWAIGHISYVGSAVMYSLSFVIGGYAKAKEGLLTLIREKDLDVDLLMMLAAISAASIGYWMEGALLIFIFAVSGALESYKATRS